MAYLTQKEFCQAIELLAGEMGLQRLRDRLARLNGLVSRRGVRTAEALAEQLYMLSGGLRRQVPATFAFHGVWRETLSRKIGEKAEKELEKLAEAVNECLTPAEEVIPEKAEALEKCLAAYGAALRSRVGRDFAYLDMLLKAVPAVAELLRAKGIPEADEAGAREQSAAEGGPE